MANQGTEERAAAFREHLVITGEKVYLKDGNRPVATFPAVINRGLDARAVDKGALDFGERDKTHLEFAICELSEAPRAGWHFEEACGGMTHRIKVVRSTDVSWKCDCEVSRPLTAAEKEEDEAAEE